MFNVVTQKLKLIYTSLKKQNDIGFSNEVGFTTSELSNIKLSSIESYAEMVASFADNSTPDLISNGRVEHAKILINNLFSHTQEKICIFSSELISEIYESKEVLNHAKELLASGKKIEILLQDVNDISELNDHKFIALCREHEDSCEFKIVNEADRGIESHMVVMDKKGFRFCPNKKIKEAIGSFNNPEISSHLFREFQILFRRAVPLCN